MQRVAVIERNLARATGVGVGDRVTVATAAGAARFRIVGIAAEPAGRRHRAVRPADDAAIRARRADRREHLLDQDDARPTTPSSTGPRHGSRTGSHALGYNIGTEITYVAERDEIAANRTITTSITVLGFLIVAMSMVALANAITMSVIERTREIGILRCIGARARDIRRIFTAEGITLTLAGWLLGIPLGYALDRFLVWMVEQVVNIDIPVVFPPWNIAHNPRRHARARAADHAAPDPSRRSLPARRGAPICLSRMRRTGPKPS